MRKFFKEFKEFISRGNILDMAVGVIIGNAFGKIVTSLVNDIIMPLITWAFGANSLAELSVVLKWGDGLDELGNVAKVPTLTWNYGNFIQSIIDFLIVAFCIFLVIKLIMKSKQIAQNAKERAAQGKPTKEQKEILKKRGVDLKDKAAVKIALETLAKEEEEKRLQEEAAKPKEETEADVLKEIRELLKKQIEKN